jgi:hypothetical protein
MLLDRPNQGRSPGTFEVAGYDERGTLVRSPTKRQPVWQGVPTRADRLRSEIGQLEARYDSGAMPPGIYAVLKKMRAELAKSRPINDGCYGAVRN